MVYQSAYRPDVILNDCQGRSEGLTVLSNSRGV